jgi:hypothetical protein
MQGNRGLWASVLLGCMVATVACGSDDDDARGADGGGENGAGATGSDAVEVTLSGAVQKGPFVLGSSVDVSQINDSGNPTGRVYSTQTTTDLGEFTVVFAYQGFVSLEANGYYYNEISGTLSESPITLLAFHEITASGTQTAYINLVTHLSYNRVKTLVEGTMAFADAVAQAEEELRFALGVGPDDFDPGVGGINMNIAGGDTDANAYLFAVSAVIAKAAELRGGPLDARLQELVNAISADLAPDGVLETTTIQALQEAELALDPPGVMAAFGERLAELGSEAEVADLNRVLDTDSDGTVNAEDSDDDGDGVNDGDDLDPYDPALTAGAWCDTVSGLCWEYEPASAPMPWSEASQYCEDLELEGIAEWRLPTIDELRTLIRPGEAAGDCAQNVPDGLCGVTAVEPSGLDFTPCHEGCGQCTNYDGPGREGCYWPPALEGSCDVQDASTAWSSSPASTDEGMVWGANFNSGGIILIDAPSPYLVRCARDAS